MNQELQTLLQQIKDCYNNEFTNAERFACTGNLLGEISVLDFFESYHPDVSTEIIELSDDAKEAYCWLLTELCEDAEIIMDNIDTDDPDYIAACDVAKEVFGMIPKKFNDFDFSIDNDTYVLNIHDCANNDNFIVVDYGYVNSDEDARQFLFKSKPELAAVLKRFFRFDADTIKEALDQIKESEAA